jgi:hypothetical protein
MRILLQDLRYAFGLLLKNPGFAVVTVLTLALGIGANTAIFSVLDSVLLRELPVPNPQELSLLTDPDSHGSTFGGQGGERSQLAYSEFQYLRDHNEVFSRMFAADSQINSVNVSIGTASASAEAHTELVRAHLVSGDYFSTLGVKPAAGQLSREITAQDTNNGLRAAVINETFAHRFFPNTSPIGKHIRDTYPGNPADCAVVGVAADAKYNSLREKNPPRIYIPLFNPMWDQNSATYEVRTFADTPSVSTSLRSAVQEVSESLPPITIHTITGLGDDTLQTDRFIERLSSAFGFVAILLASIGLYGVMAYNVARRTRDIGIRMALGAEPGSVRWQILRETLMLVFIGIAIGVPAALAGTRLVRSTLFGLGFADPMVMVSAAALLALVAALAGFLPARRASQVDPMVALRYE